MTQDTFVFISGNAAMNAMAYNWAASVYKLGRRAFNFVTVPLDDLGATDLQQSGFVPVYLDRAAMDVFQPREGLFGARDYKAMARYKWDLALRVVQLSSPVLWSDPDIVILRNPLRYLDTIPDCDITLQGEIAAVSMLNDVLEEKASPIRHFAHYADGQCQLFNTGFVRILPTEASLKLLHHVKQASADLVEADSHHDDQEIFNALILHQYELVGANYSSPAERYTYFRRQMTKGQCATFRRIETNDTFTLWLLNPLTFPLRPTHDDSRMRELALEPPFIKHYNWLVGAQNKMLQMRRDCMWFLR